jgi:hypothetical protein
MHAAVDERRFVGGKVQGEVRDLHGLTQAANRLALVKLGAHFFLLVLMILLEVALDERRIDGARTNAIHAKLRGIVERKLPRHRYDCAFGGTISETLLHANQTGNGPDIDDAAVGADEQRNSGAGSSGTAR